MKNKKIFAGLLVAVVLVAGALFASNTQFFRGMVSVQSGGMTATSESDVFQKLLNVANFADALNCIDFSNTNLNLGLVYNGEFMEGDNLQENVVGSLVGQNGLCSQGYSFKGQKTLAAAVSVEGMVNENSFYSSFAEIILQIDKAFVPK
jgi:hypothetical protein